MHANVLFFKMIWEKENKSRVTKRRKPLVPVGPQLSANVYKSILDF